MSEVKFIISNPIDTVIVDNTHRVINQQTSVCQLILLNDNEIIEVSLFNISAHGMTNVLHSISNEDGSNMLTVIFNENAIVLKNATIHIIATCLYNNQIVNISANIKYIPITKDEICKLHPSSDIIKADSSFNYTPSNLNIKINRLFDGIEKIFDTYKDYKITYTFSDDLLNEYNYNPNTFINCNLILNKKTFIRKPDYLLVNLYKNKVSNIPELTIRIKIQRDLYEPVRNAKIELDNDTDTIITDDEYQVIDDTIISTTIRCYASGQLCKILLNDYYNIDINISSLIEEETDLILNIQIMPELQGNELKIHIICDKGVKIPKRTFINFTVFAQYNDNPNIITGICKFILNASGTQTPIYQLQPNANAIRINRDNVRDPLIIGVNKYKWLGNQRDITDYGFVLYSLDASEPQLYTLPINTADVENNVLFEYYAPNMTLLARELIYLVSDGIAEDELKLEHFEETVTYYLVTDKSDKNNYKPSYDEDWQTTYPYDKLSTDTPYLWMYQSQVFENPNTSVKTTHYTIPSIIYKYTATLIDVETLYYVAKVNKGVKYGFLNDVLCVIVNDTIQLGEKWTKTIDSFNDNKRYLWQLIIYKYSDNTEKIIDPNLIYTHIIDDIEEASDEDEFSINES